MKRLTCAIFLLCTLLLVPALAQAADPVAQIITAVNMTKTGDNVTANVVFARTYGERIYRVYYNTTNSSDLTTWKYATFTGTPLANTVTVNKLAANTAYYFKVKVFSAMGSTIVDSDVWKLDTTSSAAGVYEKSYVPVGSSVDNPVDLSVPFTNDAGSTTINVTVPAAVSQTVASIEVESRLVDGNTALTIDPKDANGNKVTTTSDALTFVIPYDSGITESTLNLGYTHEGTSYTVKKIPTQGSASALLASDGFYWQANNSASFVFAAKKFSTLTQAPKNTGEQPVPASTPLSLVLVCAGALGLIALPALKKSR